MVGRGNGADTRGTAFVVYEDIYDAKNACEHLNGFNVCGRYLVVLYYHSTRGQKKDANQQQAEIDRLKNKYNLQTPKTTSGASK